MELLSELPIELQHKVLYFVAEHPVALMGSLPVREDNKNFQRFLHNGTRFGN